ncbi:MAG: hypothetical protein ACE15B_04625 [Bryobacteraceae bacterium]
MRERGALGLGLALALTLGVAASQSDYAAARRKFAAIAGDKLKPGSRVSLTRAELNAYIQLDLARRFPDGVRNLSLDLAKGAAVGSALVDFNRVRRAQGKAPGWFWGRILEGERPVRVTARVASGNGWATVNVQEVEISGMTLDGPVLDYLVSSYVLPNYPGAKVGEAFELGHNIDRLEIQPGVVHVVIRR